MEGWKRTSLSEACQFISGLWKGEVPPFVHVGVIRNTNFTKDGTLDDSDIAHLDVEARKFAKRRLQYGDLILEKSGGGPKQPVGRVAFFDKTHGDYSFSNFTAAMRVIEPDKLDPLYLHRYLHWVYVSGRTEAMQSHSTGIRNLNGDVYKGIMVDFPPIPEQRRIVAILDEAFEAIATARTNTEKNLQNAQAVYSSGRETMLAGNAPGWVSAPLVDLCDIKHGYAFEGKFFAQGGDYVLLTPGNFYESGGYRDRGEKQKYFVGEIPRDFVLGEGDLLVAMTEQAAGLLGSPLLVPESERFLHNQRLGLIVSKPGVVWTNAFFFHVFNLVRVRAEIHASASGVKVKHTSPSKISAVRVAFPVTMAEQLDIASSLDALAVASAELAMVNQQKLLALDKLKKSLLHQAFTGALTAKSTDKQLEAVA
jgi:type I restriction enzyme S subunit